MNLWLDGQAHYALEDMVPGKYTARHDANVIWEIDPTGGPIGEPCVKVAHQSNQGNDGLTVTAQRTQGGVWTGGAGGVFGLKLKVDDIRKSGGVGNINYMGSTFFVISYGNGAQLGVGLNSDGTFSLYPLQGYNGAPPLEVSNGGVASGIWSSLEFKWIINKTSGLFQIRHNRNLIMNRTGLPVYPNHYPYPAPLEKWSSIRILGGNSVVGAPHLTMRMCHAYLNDLGGAVNNDYLGPIRVITLRPNGPGAAAEHAPSAAQPNWELVKDVHPDGDASYVTAGVIGAKDLYAHENLPPGAIPLAVQSYQFVRAVTAGTPAVQTALKMGGAVPSLTPGLGLSGLSYGYQLQPMDTDPGTPGVPFTAANINAGEAGPGKQA